MEKGYGIIYVENFTIKDCVSVCVYFNFHLLVAVAEVTTQLEILYITIAVVSGASYLLILFLFKNEPTYPPSVAEHNRWFIMVNFIRKVFA